MASEFVVRFPVQGSFCLIFRASNVRVVVGDRLSSSTGDVSDSASRDQMKLLSPPVPVVPCLFFWPMAQSALLWLN